jgi:hypothetical protein
MMTSFLLVVAFGTGFAGNTAMVKYDSFAECDAARTAVIEAYELDERLAEKAKCVEVNWEA